MLTISELRKISRARLKDAEVLLASRRYDGAIYICGYSVEIALKARICRTLHWQGYPSTNDEFRRFQTFRTHDLDVLLQLSGRELKVKNQFFAEWSGVAQWNPEARYKPVGNARRADAKLMIESSKVLLSEI